MKLVFWGSSDFSMPSLELCHEAFGVAAVITNTDACCGRGMKEIRMTPVKRYALDRGIPVLQPCDLKDASFQQEFAALRPDLSAVVSYGMIIPESVLHLPRLRSVNVHASLLPKYRGASPIQAAIANGDTTTGVTVQAMVKELDRGDILLQKETALAPDETYPGLCGRLARMGAEILEETVRQLENGTARPRPQDESRATLTRLIRKEDGRVSFIENTARDIYNRWRAYCAWPGVFTQYRGGPEREGTTVYLTQVELSGESGAPGTVIRADRNALVVACREGSVSVRRIKPAGKKDMDFAGFMNGYRPAAGKPF